MFIKWIGTYSELHFAVIKFIYRNPGSTRKIIWLDVHGSLVREDSAEADLYKLLIRDLSTGEVVRQHREKDYYGRYVKETPKPRGQASQTLTSAFDDEKKYELTELGTVRPLHNGRCDAVHWTSTDNTMSNGELGDSSRKKKRARR